jgi:hypothetical protein
LIPFRYYIVQVNHYLAFAVLLISALKRKKTQRGKKMKRWESSETHYTCNGGKRVRKIVL